MLRLSELVRSYEAHTGEIEVVGWIKTARESKNVGFIELGEVPASRTCRWCTKPIISIPT